MRIHSPLLQRFYSYEVYLLSDGLMSYQLVLRRGKINEVRI